MAAAKPKVEQGVYKERLCFLKKYKFLLLCVEDTVLFLSRAWAAASPTQKETKAESKSKNSTPSERPSEQSSVACGPSRSKR